MIPPLIPPLIGVDIDDTLADWTEFPPYAAIPSPDSVRILNLWHQTQQVQIVYITSRKRERQTETVAWLTVHGYPEPTRVLFEEDSIGGKPATLRKRNAVALIDDMPATMEVAAEAGLKAYWRDIPKNKHFPRPAPHPNLLPWHTWADLEAVTWAEMCKGG